MRPKPQLIQQASAEMTVTKAMAPAGVLGFPAKALIPFLIEGAAANAEPLTNTKAICMAKANNDHTPLPQCSMTSTGVWWQTGMAMAMATKVRMTAKIKGSGRYFWTTLTQKRMILWNISRTCFGNYSCFSSSPRKVADIRTSSTQGRFL